MQLFQIVLGFTPARSAWEAGQSQNEAKSRRFGIYPLWKALQGTSIPKRFGTTPASTRKRTRQRPPGRPAPLPAAETGHTLANPCHPRQRKRGDRVSGGAEAQRGDSTGCACEAAGRPAASAGPQGITKPARGGSVLLNIVCAGRRAGTAGTAGKRAARQTRGRSRPGGGEG